MKPFVFKLQTALDIKQRQEEGKKEELLKATTVYNEALHQVKQMQSKLIDSQQKMRDKQKQEIDYQAIRFYIDYIQALHIEIQHQENVTEELRQKMEQVRLELVEAIKQRKVLEKLKAKHYQAYLKEYLREEQKLIDEMATAAYIRKERAI